MLSAEAIDARLVSDLRATLDRLDGLDPDLVRWRHEDERETLRRVVWQALAEAERLLLFTCSPVERARRVDGIRRALPAARLQQVLAMAEQTSDVGPEAV